MSLEVVAVPVAVLVKGLGHWPRQLAPAAVGAVAVVAVWRRWGGGVAGTCVGAGGASGGGGGGGSPGGGGGMRVGARPRGSGGSAGGGGTGICIGCVGTGVYIGCISGCICCVTPPPTSSHSQCHSHDESEQKHLLVGDRSRRAEQTCWPRDENDNATTLTVYNSSTSSHGQQYRTDKTRCVMYFDALHYFPCLTSYQSGGA